MERINMNIKIILALVLITQFFACIKDLDYRIAHEDKIVVNASISPQNGIEVRLSKTISPSETAYFTVDDLKLENAKVELYRMDTLLTQLEETDKGFYRATEELNISEGEQFYIKILADNFSEVTTERVTIPQGLTNTDFIFEQLDEGTGEIIAKFENSNTTPFVTIDFIGKGENAELLNINFLSPDYQNNGLCDVAWSFSGQFLDTSCLSEGEANMRLQLFSLDDNRPISNGEGSIPVKKINFNLRNINEDFFRYVQTYDPESDFFESIGSEIQPLHTNILNGYGVFVAENVAKYQIEL